MSRRKLRFYYVRSPERLEKRAMLAGAGSLVLSSNPTGTEQALPLDFPTNLSPGSTLTVGTLTGTLAASGSATNGTSAAVHIFGRRR